ncbi:cysteine synthase [Desulfobacca acetoxidans]|uniref:Cysteine--tRNA ligase n=1 Tax=Desulfobacca acetoxidans (strain ATCC 700848 / DSM 11109 / ASRB2) TaxID=880072 RepID=F2NHB2_DESAR|nr:cysteine synthase [Desulfobacca acetoxidans]AEB08954.1 cysteine synthase [Desulfobacca acetoxidans DSM 11109]
MVRGCYQNILELIGDTPLVRLNRLNTNPRVQVYVKLEYFNPGGSIKDRVAWEMLRDAEARGDLTPGKTVIEATSGNTGIGLAMVCAVRGFPCLLAMSESASEERKLILKALGAQILLTPASLGTDGAIEEVYRLAREFPDKYYLPDQFNNPSNPMAHYHGTAQEIYDQTEGRVTMVVATLGTSGTLMGLYRRLKELNQAIQIIGVEPYPKHKLQGLKNMKESYKPGIFDKTKADLIINVDDEEAFETARRLAREEGLFLGMSSGAAVAIALKMAQKLDQGLIVAIAPDSGERYLSTPLFAEKARPTLCFFNTEGRSKQAFLPQHLGQASIYTDGPTMDGYLTLTDARRLMVADLLRRYLEYRGYQVKQVVNLTDLDDRTIRGAVAAGLPLNAFTQQYIDEFFADIDALRLKRAEVYPKATDHIDDMVALVKRLLEKGYAYEKLRSVYFDISRFRGYGKLSHVNLEKIRLGKTVDLDDYEKDNPCDFTLLKRAKLGELKLGLYYPTEWGNVRPGWHLECAAMALKHLGESFDIVTGGSNLIFPHHENVIAICEAVSGKPLARYWLHNESVLGVMAAAEESEGPTTVRRLFQTGVWGVDLRFLLLATHYRKTLHLSNEALDAARRSRRRLDLFLERLNRVNGGKPEGDLPERLARLESEFTAALDDDLNIAGALAALFNFQREINIWMDRGRLAEAEAEAIIDQFRQFDRVLGVMNFPTPAPTDAAIEEKLREREEARGRQDFARADEIRQELAVLGIEVLDTPTGPAWRRR